MVPAEQGRLDVGPAGRATHRLVDYDILPERVNPTTLETLHQRGSFLFVIRRNYRQELSPAQKRLVASLLRYNHVDAPGSVWVLVVWGKGITARAYEVYAPHGHEDRRACDTAQIQRWISDWFHDQGRP